MNPIPLGDLAAPDAGRDAIHIAVAPVIASEVLKPGEHVGLLPNGKAGLILKPLGIVDPYLIKNVQPGELFYLCLYPNTITSLRHHWVHPDFVEENTPKVLSSIEASEAWLRQYAKEVNPQLLDDDPSGEVAYQTLMDNLREGALTYHGTDMHGRGELLDAAELQRHASIVIGREIDFDTFEYFSCTC